MSRSKWKFLYVDPILMYQLDFLNNLSEDLEDASAETDVISTWSRNSTILPEFIGALIEVHNGQSFSLLRIKSNMVKHKLGEFVLTKKTGSKIHILKNKKK